MKAQRAIRFLAGIAALALVLASAACAPRVDLPRYDDVLANKAAFQDRFVTAPMFATGVVVRASLLYSTPARSNRTDVQLFGDYGRPLRLDVRAGLGTMVALMREDQSGLLAYYPDKKSAYAHMDPVIGAQLLGLPFPFSMRDLALVLAGHFRTLVPPDKAPIEIRALPDGGFAYVYATGPVRLLAVDVYGRPQRMEGELSPYFKTQAEREGEVVSGPRVWSLVFSDFPEDDGDPQGPARVLTLNLPKGESAVLRVKGLDERGLPWPVKSLSLMPPSDTKFMALDRKSPPPASITDVVTGGKESSEHGQPEEKAHG